MCLSTMSTDTTGQKSCRADHPPPGLKSNNSKSAFQFQRGGRVQQSSRLVKRVRQGQTATMGPFPCELLLKRPKHFKIAEINREKVSNTDVSCIRPCWRWTSWTWSASSRRWVSLTTTRNSRLTEKTALFQESLANWLPLRWLCDHEVALGLNKAGDPCVKTMDQ